MNKILLLFTNIKLYILLDFYFQISPTLPVYVNKMWKSMFGFWLLLETKILLWMCSEEGGASHIGSPTYFNWLKIG